MSSYSKDLETVADLIEKFIESGGIRGKEVDKYEIFAMLPHPTGRGSFVCGKPAYDKLRTFAYRVHKNSKMKNVIYKNDVFEEIKKLFVVRYISEVQEITSSSAEEIAREAVELASRNLVELTHIFPVHLGHTTGVEEFQIGPVYFRRGNKSKSRIEKALLDFRNQHPNSDHEYISDLSEDASAYYDAFHWSAEVFIGPMERSISENLGFKIVQDSINSLNIMLGHSYSFRMSVGGLSPCPDKRSHLSIKSSGEVSVSASVSWADHALGEDWWNILNEQKGNEILYLMGVAIENGNKLEEPNQLSRRFLDALSWYGEAVRDQFVASSIIKYVTSLERLFLTKKTTGSLKSKFSERASAFLYSATCEPIEQIESRFSSLYTLRSNLVHGKTAPQSDLLENARYNIDKDVCITIQQYILLAREEGLKRASSSKRLEEWLQETSDLARKFSYDRHSADHSSKTYSTDIT